MKNETKQYSSASESRKIRKPLIEKKRRARINDSLETLKQILLESRTTFKKTSGNGHRTAKLEKADILEMTVAYLQTLKNKLNQQTKQNDENIIVKSAADSTCDNIKFLTLIPAKLKNGDVAYILPQSSNPNACRDELSDKDIVWRPW